MKKIPLNDVTGPTPIPIPIPTPASDFLLGVLRQLADDLHRKQTEVLDLMQTLRCRVEATLPSPVLEIPSPPRRLSKRLDEGRRNPVLPEVKRVRKGDEDVEAFRRWIAEREGAFTANDVPVALQGGSAYRCTQRLCREAVLGTIIRVTAGTYRSGGKAKAPSAPTKSRQPAAGLDYRNPRQPKQLEAIMQIARGPLFSGIWFDAKAMIAELQRTRPELVASPGQLTDVRVRLIDCAGNGRLERMGTGSTAKYRCTVAAAAASAEKLNVHVPRDPNPE